MTVEPPNQNDDDEDREKALRELAESKIPLEGWTEWAKSNPPPQEWFDEDYSDL